LVTAPDDLYLADFDISTIRNHANEAGQTEARLEPYWRVRGRRGQNYFHLYSRGVHTTEPEKLRAQVKFFEVPPGSIARAGIAAAAAFIVVAATGWLVTQAPSIDTIDTQIAAFLLALPGLAAAWVGFESRPSALLEGTLAARVSLGVTFLLSLAASILLLLERSHVSPIYVTRYFAPLMLESSWSILICIAAIHAGAVASIWWSRNRFYTNICVKSVGESAVVSPS
jgi:hypothetical protein